ncbi:MAG TPA: hypothetical protein VF905_04105 [Nitrospirota bacterium]
MKISILDDYPLLKMDNVVCAPHIGYVTRDAHRISLLTTSPLNFLPGGPI